ncbi:MAG TPA: hypothetical protein VMW12_07880 [Candidatus Dormibacteraeota bacterium]|nr:hypothetical protein [Candidatus Dormibacteraeota bacterium]
MDNAAAGAVGRACESLLLAQMLAPMTKSWGEFGSLGTQTVADAIAGRDTGGFAAAIARALEARHD